MNDRIDWDALFGLWECTHPLAVAVYQSSRGCLRYVCLVLQTLTRRFSREKQFAFAFSLEKYLEVNIQYSILAPQTKQIKLHWAVRVFSYVGIHNQ